MPHYSCRAMRRCQAFLWPYSWLATRRHAGSSESLVPCRGSSIVATILSRSRATESLMLQQKTAVIASSRDRLREAAKSLFAERGFEDTTTAAICRLAGTSQSQLIKHFTDKQGV